jgi:hypothetical protein
MLALEFRHASSLAMYNNALQQQQQQQHSLLSQASWGRLDIIMPYLKK